MLPTSPRPKDHLSSLPFELLCDIIEYTIDRTSSKPLASLKSLAVVNDTIHRGCVSVGLFKNFVLTLQHGMDAPNDACRLLKSNSNIAKSVQNLTISDTVIAECPSALSRFLQLLPNLKKLRIKGTTTSKPLKHGTLISFNGLLHKTLISTRYLKNLKSLDLIDLSLTHLVTDIASVNPRILQLNLITCDILGLPNPTKFTSCKVQYLRYRGFHIGQLLFGQSSFQNVTYFACPHPSNLGRYAPWPRMCSAIPNLFPNLKTFHIMAERSEGTVYDILPRPGVNFPISLTNLVYTTSDESYGFFEVLSYLFRSLRL
jgi:hypothetical protein